MFDDLDLDALNAGDVAETLEAIIKADLDYDNVDYTHSTREDGAACFVVWFGTDACQIIIEKC